MSGDRQVTPGQRLVNSRLAMLRRQMIGAQKTLEDNHGKWAPPRELEDALTALLDRFEQSRRDFRTGVRLLGQQSSDKALGLPSAREWLLSNLARTAKKTVLEQGNPDDEGPGQGHEG